MTAVFHTIGFTILPSIRPVRKWALGGSPKQSLGRALCALFAVVLLAGCSGISATVSPVYADLFDKVPFKADHQIARNVEYIFLSFTEMNGTLQDPWIATSQGFTEGAKASTLLTGFGQPATPGTNWSDIYSDRARQAARKGDRDGQKLYSSLAVSSLETQTAMDNMVSNVTNGMAIYGSVMDGLAGLAQSWHDSDGIALRDWAVDITGAIGESAPKGSVLYLEIKRIFYAKRFVLSSTMDFVVNATLDDGKGNILRTAHGFQWLTHSGEDTRSPPDFIPITSIPAERYKVFERDLRNVGWGYQFALLINGAIEDLYKRREALEQKPG